MGLGQGSADNERYVLVGRISGLYGVQGWLRVYSYTQSRDNILDYEPWYLRQNGAWQARRLMKGRVQGKGIVVALEGIDERDVAALWVGCEIAVHRNQLPPPEEGEYYWADLIGLQVITVQGEVLGQVDRLLETGANDVLVVRGERERLLPFLMGMIVKQVDLQQGLLTVDWDPDF
ncbi:ribosome maturation factor RimM [Nitrosococcus watsonii]|uniref:Ribosome maturation factor RimM n=1 Tax=Nitrosococcus watsoni (strain C-113) TaxID=105559 RepID=D8K7P7_NITWC|nr:ribosome maturation factor RimM [Nitrosococcus watsonii]ADJ28924.1 16S rRNA processing protein RimM [Nitrosococcus watsonii C-113]